MEALHNITVVPDGFPVSLQVVAATALIGLAYAILTRDRPYSGFPIIDLKQELGLDPKFSWILHGRRVIDKGLAQCSGAFQVVTGTGPKIILPNRFAEEIRNDDAFNFNRAFEKDFFAHYPGFEGPRQGLTDDSLIQETVRVKLTQSLNLVTDDLVDETTASLHDIFGEDSEWKTTYLKQDILNIVARLSSRVFLGKKLCRDPEWLRISKDYTIDSFMASNELRLWPAPVRPIVHWFMPICRKLRQEVRDADRLITPEVERRKAVVDAAVNAGDKPAKIADTIGWMYQVSRGRKVSYVGGQLALSLAAIHTTTETMVQAILDMCEYPEIVKPLRDEVISVIGEHGWAKTSLYKLKLMDSFLKESQRVNAMSQVSMNRVMDKRVQLSDGTVLPRGARVMVESQSSFTDPTTYPEPAKFDAYRFLHMRGQPGQENGWQFVSTSPQHMGFGHGKHACPGRFFASNEIKIALAEMVLKYDWKFKEGQTRPENINFEVSCSSHPMAQVEVRRREAEIEL